MEDEFSSNEILLGFNNIVNHVELNCLEKCRHEVTKSDSVALLMVWYVDNKEIPIWMNVCIRSEDSNDYFEMQLLDSNIDEIQSEKSDDFQVVIKWINHALSSSKTKCGFESFIQ